MAYNMLYETYVGADDYSLSLKHHGIKGQKWGVRRFQNADGSLTDAGRKRYGYNPKETKREFEKVKRTYKITENGAKLRPAYDALNEARQKANDEYDRFWEKGNDDPEYKALVNQTVNQMRKNFGVINGEDLDDLIESSKNRALSSDINERRTSGIEAEIYANYKKSHPNIQALDDDEINKQEDFWKAADKIADELLSKHGYEAMNNWGNEERKDPDVAKIIKPTPARSKEMLAGLLREEAENPGTHAPTPTMLERIRGKMAEVNQTISEKKAQRAEAERAKAIENGDVKTVLKYADTMSTNELREVINRANTMRQLNDLANSDRKSTMERIQNAATKMANFGNAIANAKGAYDRLQKAFATEDNVDPVEKARNDAYEKSVNADAIKAMNKARDQAKAAGASTKDQELAAYVARQKHYEAADYAKKRTAELNEARARAEATIKRQNTMKQVKELPGKAQSSFYKILDGGEWVTNKDGNSEWRQTKVSDLFKKK